MGYIGRVRTIARKAAQAYADLRAELGYPLIKDEAERARWIALRDEARAKAGGKSGRDPAPSNGEAATSPATAPEASASAPAKPAAKKKAPAR